MIRTVHLTIFCFVGKALITKTDEFSDSNMTSNEERRDEEEWKRGGEGGQMWVSGGSTMLCHIVLSHQILFMLQLKQLPVKYMFIFGAVSLDLFTFRAPPSLWIHTHSKEATLAYKSSQNRTTIRVWALWLSSEWRAGLTVVVLAGLSLLIRGHEELR